MSQPSKTRLMTIKERLELDVAVERRIARARSIGMTNADNAIRAAETFRWKRRNPAVTEIFFNRGTSKYFYPGQGRAQQSLFRQVIQFDLPDNEQLKRAA